MKMMNLRMQRSVRKVFGVGWAKTGTTSLGRCFEILGYSHQGQHMDLMRDLMAGRMMRIHSVAAKFDAFEDWPWIMLYKDLDEWFPESRFVLTVRSESTWLKSYRNLLSRSRGVYDIHEIRSYIYGFDVSSVSDDDLLERYRAHQDDVKAYFANRHDKLLVVNWEEGDGWRELCEFLEHPLPEIAFPHENRGGYSG